MLSLPNSTQFPFLDSYKKAAQSQLSDKEKKQDEKLETDATKQLYMHTKGYSGDFYFSFFGSLMISPVVPIFLFNAALSLGSELADHYSKTKGADPVKFTKMLRTPRNWEIEAYKTRYNVDEKKAKKCVEIARRLHFCIFSPEGSNTNENVKKTFRKN